MIKYGLFCPLITFSPYQRGEILVNQDQTCNKQRHQHYSLQVQSQLRPVMYLTFASIGFDPSVPLFIPFDGSTAPIEPYTFEVHPNRDENYIEVPNNGSVQHIDGLELDSEDIDRTGEGSNDDDVYDLSEGYF